MQMCSYMKHKFFSAIVPYPEVFVGLSNSTVVLFAGMFIIGAMIFQMVLHKNRRRNSKKIGN